jgi:DNA-binding transcriptional ArsR family regulator
LINGYLIISQKLNFGKTQKLTKELKVKNTSKKSDFRPDFDVMKKAAFCLRAINHKTRQEIVYLIHKNGEMTVSDIYATLGLEQSVTSTFLAILRKSGIVQTRREAQSIYYSLNYSRIGQIEKSSREMLS